LVGMAVWFAAGLVIVVKWLALRLDFDRALGLDVEYAWDWTGWHRHAAAERALASPEVLDGARDLQHRIRQRRWRLLFVWPFVLFPCAAAGSAAAAALGAVLGQTAADRILGVVSLLIVNAGALVAIRSMWTRVPRPITLLALGSLIAFDLVLLAYFFSR
jgi:hypothetical protein